MRKGNVKILLLMLFVLVGLAFVFLLTLKSSNMADKTAQAVEQEDPFQLAQMETKDKKEMKENGTETYSKELEEFRRMVTNLEQKDTEMFKTQTREAFVELAELIEDLKIKDEKTSALNQTMVEEESTKTIRESARDITAADTPDKLVRALQNTFNASRDALADILREYKSADRTMDTKMYEERLSELRTKTNEINKENHKERTKELFLNFHSILKKMHMEMQKIEKKMEKQETQ